MARRPAHKDVNKRIANAHGCIMTGVRDDIDPAHCPHRQSHGAGWGLLEFVPLSRYWHRRYDDPTDRAATAIVEASARFYHARMLRQHEGFLYMGPPERIEEVRSWMS